MAQDLSTLNLQEMTAVNGFFNELETDVMNSVVASGSGFYKLTREKNYGKFLLAELVTEAPDDAVLSTDPVDRLHHSDDNYDYLFVKFVVHSV